MFQSRPDFALRDTRTSEAHRGDLRQDAKRRLLRPATAEVQADWAVHSGELLLGEPLLPQRVESVLIRLAAADRADVTGGLLQNRAQSRQVELRIVREDDHVGGAVDRHLAQRLIGPRDDELVSLWKSLFG